MKKKELLVIVIIFLFMTSILPLNASSAIKNAEEKNLDASTDDLKNRADILIKLIDKDGRNIVGHQVDYKFKTGLFGIEQGGDARTRLNGIAYVHLTAALQPNREGDYVRVWSMFKGETKYWPSDGSFHQIAEGDVENGIYQVFQFNSGKSKSKPITQPSCFTQILKLFTFLKSVIN